MSKHILYLILLPLLALTACETVIPYNGPTEPQMLVLNCEYRISDTAAAVPVIYVTHSFFMGQGAVDTVRETHYYGDHEYTYTYYRPSAGWVTDAEVSVRVDDGPWVPAHYDAERCAYLPTEWTTPAPGARIAIRASHPKHGEVETYQTVPRPLTATGEWVSTDANGLTHFRLHLPAYEGDDDEVIGIRCIGTLEQSFRTSGYPHRTWTDTIDIRETYSLEPVFGQLHNLQSTSGYYGASGGMLYLPASALRTPLTLDMYADWPTGSYWGGVTMSFSILTLGVEVCATTIDDYRYTTSLRSYRLADPHGRETGNDGFDINEILEEVGEMLGAQEPTQIYTNITGGLGHFAVSQSHVVMIR